MTTRAEMVEACVEHAFDVWWIKTASDGLLHGSATYIATRQGFAAGYAAATLTRDGELRERLAEFAKKMWRDREARGWADELSALLKEEG